MTRTFQKLTLAAMFACGTLVSIASAQQLTGDIKGTVTDVTGSAVPDAQVTATNTQTGVVKTVPSGQDGSFQFLQLPVGVYSVTAEKTGFTKFTAENVQLVLNQTFTLAVKLQVGSVSQTVEVQANSIQVETSTTQLGTVIQSQTIVDLPLNGRNW